MSFASDSFSGSAGALASPWVVTAGFWSDPLWKDGSGHVYDESPGKLGFYGGVYYNVTSPPSGNTNYSVQARLDVVSNAGAGGVVGRYQTSNLAHYHWYYSSGNGKLYLEVFNGSAWTTLATVTYTPTNADLLTLVMNGSRISGDVNGVEKCYVTDTTVTAAGYPGIMCDSTTSQIMLYAWEADVLSGGGTGGSSARRRPWVTAIN